MVKNIHEISVCYVDVVGTNQLTNLFTAQRALQKFGFARRSKVAAFFGS
jgi:hypothetical protein